MMSGAMSVGASVLQIGGAFMKVTDTANAGLRAIGGAAMGAKLGAQFAGPWGAAIGAVIGGLAGLFRKPSWVKVGEQIAKDMGLDKALSKELSKAIEKMAKDLNVTTAQAGMLSLDKIMAETGKTAAEMSKQVFELFGQQFPAGSKAAEQQLQTLDTIWGDVRKSATATGDAMTVAMLKAAQASGHMTDSMKAFVSEQNKAMAGGAAKIAEGMGGMDLEGMGDFGKNAAVFFASGFQQAIAEGGLMAALDQLGEGAKAMFDQLTAAGDTAGAALLAPFAALQSQIGDNEQLKGMLTTLEGMGEVFKGAANQGLLNPEMQAAFGETMAQAHDALLAAGVDGKAAMTAIMPELKAAIDAAQQMGVPLDAKTAEMKAAAEGMGFSFPVDPMIQMVDLMKSLVTGMGFALPESAARAGDSFGGMREKATDSMGSIRDSAAEASMSMETSVKDGLAAINTSTEQTKEISELAAQYTAQQWTSEMAQVPIVVGQQEDSWKESFDTLAAAADPALQQVKSGVQGIANALDGITSHTWEVKVQQTGGGGGGGGGGAPDNAGRGRVGARQAARGGIFSGSRFGYPGPTMHGDEAVIPLSSPTDAARVMALAGLGGSSYTYSPTVNVNGSRLSPAQLAAATTRALQRNFGAFQRTIQRTAQGRRP
jgi:hypothetical protein